MGRRIFGGEKRGRYVNRHDLIEQFVRILRDRRDRAGDARVRKQHIDLAELLHSLVEVFLRLRSIGYIRGANGETAFVLRKRLRTCRELLVGAVDEKNLCALIEHRSGARKTEAPGRAGHHANLSV